jgi:hypothetical protein
VGEVAVAVETGGPLEEPPLLVLIGAATAVAAAVAAARDTGAMVMGGEDKADEWSCIGDDELKPAVAAVVAVGELDSVEEGEVLDDDPVVDVRELASVGDGGVIDDDLEVEMVCIDGGGMLLGAIDDDPTVAAIDEEGDGGTAIDLERISSSAGGSVPAIGN